MKAAIRDKSHKLPSVTELIMPSFQAIGVNWLLYISLLLLPSVIATVIFGSDSFEVTSTADLQNPDVPSSVYAAQLFSFLASPFLIYAQLKSARGNSLSFKKLFIDMKSLYVPTLICVAAVGLVTTVGLFVFIVPGLIFLKQFLLAPYYVIDDKASVLQALKKSKRDVSRYSKSVWSVIIFAICVLFLSVVSLVVPVLFVLAAGLQLSVSLMPALRYHQIREQLGWSFDETAHPPKT